MPEFAKRRIGKLALVGPIGKVGLRHMNLRVWKIRLAVFADQTPYMVRMRVADHHRVDVHVDHARVRADTLRDLVHVLVGGQPRADVNELRDALASQETHGPLEEVVG